MKWKKSSPELVAAFDAALPDDRRVQRRSMFGYPCAFAGGNMFTGLFQDSLFVRLGGEERDRLLGREGAALLEPMPGRPMREYVVLPPELIEDAAELRGWIARSLDYASALPPKGAKAAGTTRRPKPAAGATRASPRKGAAAPRARRR